VGDEIISINKRPVVKNKDFQSSVNAIHFTHLITEMASKTFLDLDVRVQSKNAVLLADTRLEVVLLSF
jgi:hypothetical protein